jgi:DNA-binding CsgD family transcriptional regulator
MQIPTSLRPVPFEPGLAPAVLAPISSRAGRRASDRPADPPWSEAAPDWLGAALDEIDYGVLVVDADGQVAHRNRAARCDLDDTHPLEVVSGQLRARASFEREALRLALHQAASQGLRRLLTIGGETQPIGISVVPLGLRATRSQRGTAAVLVLLGKREMCGHLSVHGYARSLGLTPTEGKVLAELCNGAAAREVAQMLGVALSTVRTHINSIRAKTGADSICSLVRQMAVLPPLMGALGLPPGQALGPGLRGSSRIAEAA